jgi:hypothetical protein
MKRYLLDQLDLLGKDTKGLPWPFLLIWAVFAVPPLGLALFQRLTG